MLTTTQILAMLGLYVIVWLGWRWGGHKSILLTGTCVAIAAANLTGAPAHFGTLASIVAVGCVIGVFVLIWVEFIKPAWSQAGQPKAQVTQATSTADQTLLQPVTRVSYASDVASVVDDDEVEMVLVTEGAMA